MTDGERNSPTAARYEDSDGPAIRTTGPFETEAPPVSKTESFVDEVDSLSKNYITAITPIEDSDGSAIKTVGPEHDADFSKTDTFADEIDSQPQSNCNREKERAIRTDRPEYAIKNISMAEKILGEHENGFRKDRKTKKNSNIQPRVNITTPEQSNASEPSDIAIRTYPTISKSNVSKTEPQIEPTECGSIAMRISNPYYSEADLSKTEFDLSTRDDQPGPSFVTGESGKIGIRTDRPCTSKADFSKTECQLHSKDERFELKQMEDIPAPRKDGIKQGKAVMFLKSKGFDTFYTSMQPKSSQTSQHAQISFPTLSEAYEFLWTNRSSVFKTIFITWLSFSTLLISKGLVLFINSYWLMNIDDCDSVKSVCNRFGFACFSSCGNSKWTTFWYKVFGE